MKSKLRVLSAWVCLLLAASSFVFAQSTGDFRTHQTGNWDDANSWERYNGTNWITPAPAAPTGAEANIAIEPGHTITVNVAIVIIGYLLDRGVVTVSGGSLTFNNASTYEMAHPSASGQGIPTAIWNTGSTCLLTGITSATTGINANQTFHNLTVNSPNWSGNLNLGWNSGTTTINGDVRVISTGTGRWQFCAPATGASSTVNIVGNLIVDGSAATAASQAIVTSNGTGNGTTTIVVNVGGNVVVMGNPTNTAWTNFSLSRGSQGGTGTSIWNLSGDFSMSNATTQNSNNSGARFTFAKNGVQNLRFANVTFAGGAINCTVNSNATLDLDTSVVSGSGSFIMSAGSAIATKHPSGINGNITCTGANGGGNSFSTDGGYTFNGSVAQVTGSFLPATVNNLTINNGSGVTLTATTTVNGTLDLVGGNLITGANAVAVSSTGSVTRTNGQVVGNLQKNVGTGSSMARMFEVGSGSSYAPVNVTFANVTTAGDLVAATIGSEHPNIATSGIDSTKDANRHWSLTNNGVVFTTYDAVLNFVPADLDGGANPNNFVAKKYAGATWSGLTVGTRTATSTQVVGATSFSDFAVGQPPATTVQTNGTGGGDWASTSTWQGGAVPNSVDSVVIRGTDSVFVLANSSCSGLLVQSGGRMGIVAKFSATNISLQGRVTAHADTLTASGLMSVGSSGMYTHAQNGGRIPTATWNAGSIFQITGIIANAPGNGNQNFSNIIWNCPAQTGNVNMGWNGITIGGTITVVNTNTGRWQFCAPVTGDSAFVTIQGDVLLAAGNLTTNGTGNGNTKIVVNHFGNINITGGNFAISRGSQGGTGTSTWNLHNGNFSVSNAAVQNSTTLAGGAKYVFKKAGVQTLALTNITFAGGGLPVQVDSGATLDVGSSVLRGSGVFTLNAGATLACGNTGGIDSTLQSTGTKTLNKRGSFTFNAAASQATGILLPDTINNLTINNAASVTLSVGTVVNGVLTFTSGNLATGSDTLRISPAGSVSRTSGHVVGLLQKNVATGSNVTKTFEIGSGSSYAPVNVSFASVTTTGELLASTTGSDHPNIATSGIDPTHNVNRYWSMSNIGIGFTSYDAVFNFVAGDVDAGSNPNAFIAEKFSGTTWSGLTEGDRTITSTEVIDVTSFSDFAVGQSVAAAPATILSNGTGGGNWAIGSTWQGGIVPTAIDSVVIRGADSVAVLGSASCSGLLVQSGTKLDIYSRLTLSNVVLNGKIVANVDTLFPSGVMIVRNGGTYTHAQNGGRIPDATWEVGSTIELTGIAGNSPSNGNQNFYNVVWNSPNQSSNLNLGWNGNTIGGTIRVINTGLGRWQLCAPAVNDSAFVAIQGNVLVEGGQFTTNGTSNTNTKIVINHFGNVNVTGGNFAISRGSQGATGTSTWYMRNGNFTISNATTQNSNPTGGRFVFVKPGGTQSITLTNVTFAGGGLPVQIDSAAAVDAGTSVIRGSGVFTLNARGSFLCGNTGGLDSTLQNTGARTLSKDAIYSFNAATAQRTGNLLPDTVRSLFVDDSVGVTLSGNVTVNSILGLTKGILNLNGKTIVLSPTAMLSETAGNTLAGDSGLVTTRRVLNAPNVANDIAGLGIRIGSAANLGNTVISRGHGVQTAGNGSIRRYFDITPATNTGLNATFVFRYDDSELNSLPDSSLRLFKSTDNGSSWSQTGGTVNGAANTITLTGVNEFSRWTAAQSPNSTGENVAEAPLEFSLKQNHPNPFNPATTIKFTVEKTGQATIEVYNILGQKLMTLFNDVVEAGKYHTVQFNAQALSSGIYLYRLQSGSRNEVRKFMLLK